VFDQAGRSLRAQRSLFCGLRSPSGQEKDRMSDEQTKGMIPAVDKRLAAHFGQLAVIGEEELATFGFSIERIAT
jgi:hypothetical protein